MYVKVEGMRDRNALPSEARPQKIYMVLPKFIQTSFKKGGVWNVMSLVLWSAEVDRERQYCSQVLLGIIKFRLSCPHGSKQTCESE